MANVTFKEFNIGQALNGFPVGWKVPAGDTDIAWYINNFRLSNINQLSKRYVGEDAFGIVYYYDQWGNESNGIESRKLYLIDIDLSEKRDNEIMNNESLINGYNYLENMRARDYFALGTMKELLRQKENIKSIQNYEMNEIATISYKMAQAMLYVGANLRYNMPTDEITFQKCESYNDKILFKIYESLSGLNSDGLKITTTPESEMKIKELPNLNINSGNITLSNDPLNVNITNEVKITGNITTTSTEPTANLNYLE